MVTCHKLTPKAYNENILHDCGAQNQKTCRFGISKFSMNFLISLKAFKQQNRRTAWFPKRSTSLPFSAKSFWNHKRPCLAQKERLALLDLRFLLRIVNRGSQLFKVKFSALALCESKVGKRSSLHHAVLSRYCRSRTHSGRYSCDWLLRSAEELYYK